MTAYHSRQIGWKSGLAVRRRHCSSCSSRRLGRCWRALSAWGRARRGSGDMLASLAGKAPFSSISGMLTKKNLARVYKLVMQGDRTGARNPRTLALSGGSSSFWRDSRPRHPPGPRSRFREIGRMLLHSMIGRTCAISLISNHA